MELTIYAVPGLIYQSYKLTRWLYRLYLRRPAIKVSRPFRSLYRRYYAWKHRPPTPDEKRQAENHLKLVEAFIQQHWNYKNTKNSYRDFLERMNMLSEASRALRRATRLDPNVTTEVTAHDGVVDTWTVDAYAAHLLYIEALWYRAEAERYKEDAYQTRRQPYHGEVTVNFARDVRAASYRAESHEEDARKMWLKCMRAIKKALKYKPTFSRFLNVLAESYWNTDRTGYRARKTVKLSLQHDPGNVDTLKLQQEYRMRLI